MVTHASILAWRIPWTEDPGGLQSMHIRIFLPSWTSLPPVWVIIAPSWEPCAIRQLSASYLLYTRMHAKKLQSCLTLCNPVNCSPPGCSVHGILQARMLEWVAMSWGSSRPRDRTHVSYLLHWQAGYVCRLCIYVNIQIYIHIYIQCIHIYTCQCYSFNSLLSPPSLPVSTVLFSTSASLFLPCKLVHQYHFSRFHM